MNDLHGILFAYHSDSNLGELTRPRNTCSLPFGGRYRLIDFMLSSYVNAGISDVGLIVHESYQSLLDHVGSGKDWDLSRKHGGLRILPPFGVAERGGSGEYRGNMEALAGIYTYLQNIRQAGATWWSTCPWPKCSSSIWTAVLTSPSSAPRS